MLAASTVLTILLVKVLYNAYTKSRQENTAFCQQLWSILSWPVRMSFCQYISNSLVINTISYYFLMFISVFSLGLLRFSRYFVESSAPTDDPTKWSFVLLTISNLFRAAYLFLSFLVFEIMYLRSYYVKQNALNLVTTAVSISERRITTHYMLKKSFIFSAICFSFSEGIALSNFGDYRLTNTETPLYYLIRFIEYYLVLGIGFPTLSLFQNERRAFKRSKYVSLHAHVTALMRKQLGDLLLTEENIKQVIQRIVDAQGLCVKCNKTFCGHLFDDVITNHIDLSLARLKESKEIAENNLVDTLITNPRNTVGSLKIIALIFMLDFAILTLVYGLSVVAIVAKGSEDHDEISNGFLAWTRAINRVIEMIVFPLITTTIINAKNTFGQFHAILEQNELETMNPQDTTTHDIATPMGEYTKMAL